MDSTSTRSAHRRVGAATILAFLALLFLGATRGPAEADTTVPTAVPTVQPQQTTPSDPDPGFPRDHDGPRGRGGPEPDFGGGGGGGAAPAPAPAPASPSTGGSQT